MGLISYVYLGVSLLVVMYYGAKYSSKYVADRYIIKDEAAVVTRAVIWMAAIFVLSEVLGLSLEYSSSVIEYLLNIAIGAGNIFVIYYVGNKFIPYYIKRGK